MSWASFHWKQLCITKKHWSNLFQSIFYSKFYFLRNVYTLDDSLGVDLGLKFSMNHPKLQDDRLALG